MRVKKLIASMQRKWKKLKKVYRKTRRQYIERKKQVKQTVRWIFSPILAVEFILEQIGRGHLPGLDKNMFLTDSRIERWMYYELRRVEMFKGKIVPQYPISSYWADFAIPEYMLVIELDGQRYHKNRQAHDRGRDAYMYRKGWKVMRFSYNDIKKRRTKAVERILKHAMKVERERVKASSQ
ncbi:endonuclease domain-containing protein [Thermoactinomyces sp. DSM 45892]|uniref:endonuclease domain-containing protein n=1 Tax=Thermoactinomyces sp. DSM 45892 TaxID=1882753 RepID=UPI000894D068|nr:DUF559 domain-containing protein [Thermoactinomyces sp. DSM 45892]SDY84044.1 Very-short-patch-repair endonuclease [Thermoactinomyces sp. DSM 45892]